MKILLAIVTCHKFKARADAQRSTWIPYIDKMGDRKFDYKFFLGKTDERPPQSDEVYLDVPDDYKGLPYKTRAIARYALEHDYDAVFKVDDDVYVFPERLLGILPNTPYEGRLNNSQHHIAPKGWCSGFSYWMTKVALEIIAKEEPDHPAEDLWVGKTLSKHGISCKQINWLVVLSLYAKSQWSSMKDRLITVAEFPDQMMYEIHKILRETSPPPPTPVPLDKNPRNVRIFQLGRFTRIAKNPYGKKR